MKGASMSSPTVAIIGASANTERHSNRAVVGFAEKGYTVWPIHPSGNEVAGHQCFKTLEDVPGKAQIISLYVNPKLGLELVPSLVEHQPDYVWLNPGADSDELETALQDAGLKVMRSCNLVALSIGDPLDLAQQHNS